MQHITPETKEKCASFDVFSPTNAGSSNNQSEEKAETELKIFNNFPNSATKESLKENGFNEKVCISCKGIDVEIDFQTCDNLYVNEIGTLQLNYCFRIIGQKDYDFSIRNVKTLEQTSYKKIIGEGTLLLDFPGFSSKQKNHNQNCCEDETDSQVLSNNIYENDVTLEVNEVEEVTSVCSSKEELINECDEIIQDNKDSCETIEIILESETTSFNSVEELSSEIVAETEGETEIFNSSTCPKLCSNCNQAIEDGTIYLCLFGHDSCKDCKGKPCVLCQTMMGNTETYCKNHHKGCKTLETQELLAKHEIDCEFNNFRCPFPRCIFLNTLSDLKLHFMNSHTKSLIQNNNILEVLYGRKDRRWYLLCYDSLFVCSYYYYVTHIEFILQYIGANDKADSYMFEVEIKTMKDRILSKRVKCAGWNNLSLCKGVCYDYEDLTDLDNSRFQFTANLKIVNTNNNGLYTSH